jgi:hypothetical protein
MLTPTNLAAAFVGLMIVGALVAVLFILALLFGGGR